MKLNIFGRHLGRLKSQNLWAHRHSLVLKHQRIPTRNSGLTHDVAALVCIMRLFYMCTYRETSKDQAAVHTLKYLNLTPMSILVPDPYSITMLSVLTLPKLTLMSDKQIQTWLENKQLRFQPRFLHKLHDGFAVCVLILVEYSPA